MDDAVRPADLIARSKSRFTLSQARARRGQLELALLSLRGSLSDALRSYLLLHQHPAAAGAWPDMIAAVQGDPLQTLDDASADQLVRIERICTRITAGDAVTLTATSMTSYQQLAAELLNRYGVTVIAPEHALPDLALSLPTHEEEGWQRYRSRWLPWLAIVLIFIVGAATTISLQQTRSQPAAAPSAAPQTTITAPITTLGPQPTLTAAPAGPAVTVTGQVAYVRPNDGESLALRAEPGTGAGNPVLLYLEPGTRVEIIGGPVEADTYTWWQVRVANREGWCAGEFLETR